MFWLLLAMVLVDQAIWLLLPATHCKGRVNRRGNIIFLDLKKTHMFKCKIYM
jgi:hypothetical protein